jgi:hypothetical protein
MIFAGEEYNVDMGVTNDLFPQATDEAPACTANKSEPNDVFRNDLHAIPGRAGRSWAPADRFGSSIEPSKNCSRAVAPQREP